MKKRRIYKRVLAGVLSVAMLASMCPASLVAAETDESVQTEMTETEAAENEFGEIDLSDLTENTENVVPSETEPEDNDTSDAQTTENGTTEIIVEENEEGTTEEDRGSEAEEPLETEDTGTEIEEDVSEVNTDSTGEGIVEYQSVWSSGTCGENLTWELTSDGVLTISGEGEMVNTWTSDRVPWKSWQKSIKSVVIKEGVDNIGKNAFSGCISLMNVTISDGVKIIGDYAFSGCTSLTEIKIPVTVSDIGDGAFSGCTNMENIAIPSSVINIGKNVFSGIAIIVSEDNPNYSSIDGVLFSKDKTKLIEYPTMKKDETYIVPDGVKIIGTDAFSGCKSLTEIKIPVTVSDIEEGAFSGCTNLGNIRIPNSVINIGMHAFEKCKSLINLTLPEGLTSIRAYTFFECENLDNIKIPDSVRVIEMGAFQNCFNLDTVTLPESLTEIEIEAFTACKSLNNITIPSTVESIGEGVFSNCSELTNIKLSENITNIPRYAFAHCIRLSKLEMPDGVVSIGQYAFRGCESLEKLILPDSVTSIEKEAFLECANLKSIILSENLTDIGENSFASCTSLESVVLPDKVKKIGAEAFAYCHGLKSIKFSQGIEEIGSRAFRSCSNLGVLYFEGDVPVFASSTFTDVTATAYYPSGNSTWTEEKMQDYGGDITWVEWDPEEGVEEPDDVTTVVGDNTEEEEVELEIGSDVSFEIPDGFPIDCMVGGTVEMKFGDFIPVQFEREGNTFRLGIGTKDLKKFDDSSWLNFKKFVEKQNEEYRQGLDALLSSQFGTASIGMEVKPKISCYGYAEGVITEDGIQSLGGRASFGFQVKAEQEWQTAIVVVPVVIKLEGKAGIELNASIGLDLEKATVYFKGDHEITLPELKLSAGVGIAYIADVSLYGALDNKVNLETSETLPMFYDITATLSGELGASASFLFFSYEQPFFKGEPWTYFSLKAEDVVGDTGGGSGGGGGSSWGDEDKDPSTGGGSGGGGGSSWGDEDKDPSTGDGSGGGGGSSWGDEDKDPSTGDGSGGGGGSSWGDEDKDPSTGDGSGGGGGSSWGDEDKDPLTGGGSGGGGGSSWEEGMAVSRNMDPVLLTAVPSLETDRTSSNAGEIGWEIRRTDTSDWDGGASDTGVSLLGLADDITAGSIHTLQSDVYKNAEPVLIETESGIRILVYTADMKERATGNHTAVCYSIYDELSGAWKEPVILEDDGTADFNPAVAVEGENVYIAWVNTARVFNEAEASSENFMETLLSCCEIRVARLNAKDESTEFYNITKDSSADLEPAIAVVDGQPAVAWYKNKENDILSGNGENTLCLAVMKNGNFEICAEQTVDRNITAAAVGKLDGECMAAYVLSDRNLTGDTFLDETGTVETSLMLMDSAGDTHEITDGGIQAAPMFLDSEESGQLIWYEMREGKASLCYTESILEEPQLWLEDDAVLTPDYTVIEGEGSQLLVCASDSADADAEGSDLYAYVIADGKLHEPVTLTAVEGYTADPSGLWDGENYVFLFTRTDVMFGDSLETTTDLCITAITPDSSLAVSDPVYNEQSLMPGETAEITVTVINSGLGTSDEAVVQILYGDTVIGEAPLTAVMEPGASAEISVEVVVPESLPENAVFSVQVVSAQDMEPDTESVTIEGAAADLELTVSEDEENVTVTITNDSAFTTPAVLHVMNGASAEGIAVLADIEGDSNTSASLAEIDFGELGAYESETKTFSKKEWSALGAETLYLETGTGKDENILSNNSAYTYVGEKVLKDLSHLIVSKKQVEYEKGDVLSLDDMEVTIVYTDGTEEIVTDYETNADEIDMSSTGEKTLSITYTEAYQTRTVELPITVSEEAGETEVVKGDINMDQKIGLQDLMMCMYHISGRSSLTGDAFTAADINSDESITVADLMRMLYYVSGRNAEL